MAQNLAGPQGSKSRCSQAFGQSHQAIPSRVSTLGHRPSKPTPDSVADAICRRLGRDTRSAVQSLKVTDMYMDDLSCCESTCGEVC